MAGSVVAAAPAHADAALCRTYLVSVGYPGETSNELRWACQTGENSPTHSLCTTPMEAAGVSPFHANIACHLAHEPAASGT
ncbi:hypothetical protein [Streptomyces sp. B6B3]|uniref:hypothetical protein n=1 Tax=Streptomyces sp. B6B3 TaxID=3153570 RepID=UPI00325C7E6A